MTILSPKAIRFISIAMERADDRSARAVWASRDMDTSGDLSPSVARAALGVLSQFEQQLRRELEKPGIGEGEASDLSNNLGLVIATKRTLERETQRAVA